MYTFRIGKLVTVLLLAAGPAATVAHAWDDPDAAYAVAKDAYDNQQWPAAAAALRDYLDRHTSHSRAAEAHFFLAETFVQLRRYEAAQRMYDRYLRLPTGNSFAGFARYRLGETAFLLQDHERASMKFAEFVEFHPTHEFKANASRYLGEIALLDGERENAAKWFRQAMQSAQGNPDSLTLMPSIQIGLARALETSDTDAARRIYDEVIDRFPGQFAARAQLHAGMMEHRNGRGEPANIEALRAACGRFKALLNDYPEDQNRTLARYWLGRTWLELGEYDAATDEFVKAIHAAPLHELAVDLHFLAGESLSRAGKRNAAKGYYEDVCNNWPDSRFAARAKAWLKSRNHVLGSMPSPATQQQSVMTKQASASGKSPGAEPVVVEQVRRAHQYVEDQQLAAGAHKLLESIERSSTEICQHEADFLLGCCCAAESQLDAARNAFGKVIRSPYGASTEAAALAQWMIADTHQQEEDYLQAIREFLRVSVLYDEFPQWQASALLRAGICFECLGDERSAANTYARSVERFGTAGPARQTSERLQSLQINKQQQAVSFQ